MGSGVSKRQSNRQTMVQQTVSYIRDQAIYERFKGRKYVIENIAFEGGGAKGMAYCGAVLALSDLGIFDKVTRFSGTSIGAVLALLSAIGMSAEDIIENFLYHDRLMEDAPKISLIHNVLNHWGWFTGQSGLSHLNSLIQKHTGNADCTFKELFDTRGIELCIVVSNVTHLTSEYCHVKTTPHMPIGLATVMSMSIPVICRPVQYKSSSYVDGGILNNYPINAYDGWYLSMEKQNSFIQRFDSEEEPFGTFNKKTLGLLLFNMSEAETGKVEFFLNWKYDWPPLPDTKLARQRGTKTVEQRNKYKNKVTFVKRAEKFVKALKVVDENGSGDIDITELDKLFKNESISSEEDLQILFNATREDAGAVMAKVDVSGDGLISCTEILQYMEKQGACLNPLSFDPSIDISEPTSFMEYLTGILEAMQARMRHLQEKRNDKERTIGIYADYIETADMRLAMEDKQYCMKLGWLATLQYFE